MKTSQPPTLTQHENFTTPTLTQHENFTGL